MESVIAKLISTKIVSSYAYHGIAHAPPNILTLFGWINKISLLY